MLYMMIYVGLDGITCVLDVWNCILDVWTCILGVWTCTLGVWTCIVGGCGIWGFTRIHLRSLQTESSVFQASQ